MIRLRRGNVPRFGAVSGGNSLITAPPWATIARASPRCEAGYSRRCPPPMTATVVPPARSVAAWAAASIPSARPETTVTSRPAIASAILPLVARPTAVGRRVPTMATDRGPVERARRSGDVEHGRRQLDAAQPRRVVGVDQRDRPHAGPVERGELPFGIRCCVRDGPRDRRRERRRAVVEPDGGGDQPGRATRRTGLAQDAARVAEGRDQPRERHGPDALDGVEHDPRVALAVVGVRGAGADRPVGRRQHRLRRRPVRRSTDARPARGRLVAAPGAGASHPEHQPAARIVIRSTGARKRAASSRCVGPDDLRARQVRDRPRDAQQPLGPAAGQPLALREGDRPRRGDLVEATDRPERASPDAPVRRLAGSTALPPPGGRDALGDLRGRLGGDGADERRRRHPIDGDPQVDPVAQRTRDPAQVPLRDARRAGARAVGGAQLATRARVHRGHEREPRGEHLRPADPDHRDAAVLERLAERLEHVAPELGQLVAHERALVRERHLAGRQAWTAADHARVGDRVVRPAHGRSPHETRDRSRGRGRGHGGRRQCRRVVEVRQQAGDRPGQQRLARSRRPDQQHRVGPGEGDLEGPASDGLPADVREVDGRLVGCGPARRLPAPLLRPGDARARQRQPAWRASTEPSAPPPPPRRRWPRAPARSRARGTPPRPPRPARPRAGSRARRAPSPSAGCPARGGPPRPGRARRSARCGRGPAAAAPIRAGSRARSRGRATRRPCAPPPARG